MTRLVILAVAAFFIAATLQARVAAAATPATALPTPVAIPTPTPTPTPPPTPTPAPTPARRALPPPLDPIFPSADFLGPTIGVPVDLGNRFYGWFDPGIEVATSQHSTYPLTYNDAPNVPQLDQLIIRWEKQPDTVQTKHFDLGYRFSNMFGIDYRWTTAQCYFCHQLLTYNRLYGYDPVEMYGILYYPKFGQGTTVQIGRFISPPDIEAQLAPNNYLYTHSIFFDFDAYTQTGVLFSTKLSDYWTIQYGVHCGNDMSPWNPSAHCPTFEAMGRWVSPANKDSILFGVDAISPNPNMRTYIGTANGINPNGLLYGHDNLQQYNATWTHAFSPQFHNLIEGYWLYEYNTYQGGTINNGPVKFGGGGGAGAFLPGRSTATGAVDYLEYKIAPKAFASFRLDYMNDQSGWRSGFPTSYGSVTIGITDKMSNVVMVRPEVRYETAFRTGITPYDNGTKAAQTSFGMDVIVNFGNP
jgi:hypothetical protein